MTAGHLASGEVWHHTMIDGDRVADGATHRPASSFDDGGGRFFTDFAGPVAPDQPVEESWEAIPRCRSATA